MLTIGTASSAYGEAIPPNVENFVLETFCHSSCIQNVTTKKATFFFSSKFELIEIFNLNTKAFNENPQMKNITIIGTSPHTHMTGISVDTKIIRNGVDIGYVLANHHYDFNYQQLYYLKPYVNITKVTFPLLIHHSIRFFWINI